MIFTYRDPVHNLIQFHKNDEKLYIDLINCKEMQRLRRIKQLGMSFFTYAGAEHSRFTHSIGVAYIMKRIINKLDSLPASDPQKKNIKDIHDFIDIAICSAILHDIGHGPFSHVLEKFTKKKHELWSQEIVLNEKSEVNQVLRSKNKDLPQQVNDVIKRIFKEKHIVKLLSSQLDVDRFDYLIRDSLATGTTYGIYDLEWMLQVLRVGKLDNGDIEIGVDMDKGLSVVESFVLARRAMYLQVYYHKTTRGAEVLAEKILKRAADLLNESYEIFATDAVKKLLLGEDLTADEYFSLDDSVLLFHLRKWAESSDEIISDLSKRFLNRRLFKAVTVDRNKLGLIEWSEKWQLIVNKVKEKGFDSRYYLEIDQAEHSTYIDYYLFSKKKKDEEATEDIYLFDAKGYYEELSIKSALISAVRNTTQVFDRLYYPQEVREEINKILI